MNKTIVKITISIIILIISLLIYKKLSKNKQTTPEIKQRKSVGQYLFFPKEHPTNKEYKIKKSYIRPPHNEEMSLSVFIKVNNWYHNFNSWKHILHKGTHIENDTNKNYNTL